MVLVADVHRTRCVWVLFASALSACSPQRPVVKSAARMPAQVFDRAETGTHIVSLPRPSSGVVRLSLFVDAGSRDASAPQAATLAAWIAAANGGMNIEATVYPDVTEFALGCASDALARCVEQLAHALSTRDPPEAALSQARQRLHDSQRRALDREPLQALDRRALAALLGGDSARGFFPIGQPSEDATGAVEQVPAFLREHYGPGRSQLVAAGDVEPVNVRDAVSAGFRECPPALRPRAVRTLAVSDEPRLDVDFDARGAVSIAIAGRDEAQLRALATDLAPRLMRSEPRLELGGSIFAVRGGAIALLHAHAADSELALDRVARELARLKREPSASSSAPVEADDLIASSRRLGFAFGAGEDTRDVGVAVAPRSTAAIPAADGGGALRPEFAFGAALQLEAGFDAGPHGRDADAKLRSARAEHAKSAFARALGQSDSKTRGDLDRYGASVVSENGVHIDVQTAQTDDVAIAVRIANGSERDPALLHGQAAMLATLTSIACAGMGPELLHEQLARLGASLEPRVDPESYGVSMRVPKAQWQAGLDLLLRCARAPSRQATHFSDAAIQLLSRLRAQAGALSFRARAGALIAPRAPGVFAPWGDPTRLGNLNTRNLESAEREIQAATRWAIGIVGPVEVEDAVGRTARRLGDLEAGSLPKPIGNDALGPTPEIPHALNPSGVNVVAVWSARGKFGHALGARVFARALGTLLGAVDGIELLWHDGDVHGDLAFAAIALRVQPNLAGSLPKLLAAAANSFDDRVIDRSLEPAIAQARAAQNAADAQVAVRAERIARIRLGAPLGEPSEEDALRLMRALRTAVARWAVMP